MNTFHGKYSHNEKLKTYQNVSSFIDYNCIHQDLINKIDHLTCESFGYQKGKADHRGWYLDILDTDLFGNEIDGVYQTKGRSLRSKDSKQIPVYLKSVD